MFQLIYTSRVRASFDSHMAEQIAYIGAGRNAADNITGILVLADRVILQVLEGEQDKVLELFNTICRDTRHYDVCVIAEGEGVRREFPGEPMGLKLLNCKNKQSLLKALADNTPLDFGPSEKRMFA